MIVDLEEKTESGSFEIKGGGKVHLRLLSSADIRDMKKASLTDVVEYPLLGEGDKKTYHRFESQKFDSDVFNKMIWDRGITGWDGISDKNKNPIPVTAENKELLMLRSQDFREAVEKGQAALKKAEEERAEAEIKN